MKHNIRGLPWLLLALSLAIFLLWSFWPTPIKVDVGRVTRGSFTVTIDDDGETRIREKYMITAPVTGKLLRVRLHAGDLVERGKSELMQILPADPSLLDARTRAESEARVQAADAAYEESEASLISARESAELAQNQFERAEKLHATASISQAEFDEAEHHHHMAQAILRSAGFRAKVKLFEREQARASLLRVTDSNDADNAAAMSIYSPIDGRVLRVLHEDASVVTAGAPILEIGDPQDMELQIDVLSNFAVGIEPGTKVIIEHWGGTKPLHAVVRVVEPSAFLKISALGVEEKRVNVIADFVSPWEERKNLGDGFRVEARIVYQASNADSLKVPAGSLFRIGSDWHVYRVRDATTELVSVAVGLSNGQETEILHGLTEGDVVVLYPSDQIRAGIKVVEAG